MDNVPVKNSQTGEIMWSHPGNVGALAEEWQRISGAAEEGMRLTVAKRALNAQVNEKLAAVMAAGFTPATGPLAGHTLQLRDLEDRANWQDSRRRYKEYVDEGAGELPGATFRTAANVNVGCTFAEGLQALNDMEAWGWRMMMRSWTLKDQVKAASDRAALDAIDINAGWE